MTRDELNAALMAAYEIEDKSTIARLYGAAGDASDTVDEACFFWVQAYVFALDAGIEEAETYRANLARHGREN